MRFLIVDDSATMRRIVMNALSEFGYRDFVEAANGLEALQKLDGVDCVITDWKMPAMDGLALTRVLRETPGCEFLPVLLITAYGRQEDVLEALDAGVTTFVVKPFKPATLHEKIVACCGSEGESDRMVA